MLIYLVIFIFSSLLKAKATKPGTIGILNPSITKLVKLLSHLIRILKRIPRHWVRITYLPFAIERGTRDVTYLVHFGRETIPNKGHYGIPWIVVAKIRRERLHLGS